MRAIFVETQRQEFQAPSGATSSQYAAPDGAFSFCELVFYKYAAPLALDVRRGATLEISQTRSVWSRPTNPCVLKGRRIHRPAGTFDFVNGQPGTMCRANFLCRSATK
jgi:hypothetical protein